MERKGKNKVIIFAGGIGQRMKYQKPKQFIIFRGTPVIIHTILKFENHPMIDEIYVVVKEGYEKYTTDQIKKYNIKKVKAVVKPECPDSGLNSVYTGLLLAAQNSSDDDIVLIHDGVRPLVEEKLITENINVCRTKGNAVSCSNMTEPPVIINDNGEIIKCLDRKTCKRVKAPQTFYLKDILEAHNKIRKEFGNYNKFLDSSGMMNYLGIKCNIVESPASNIKITTKDDIYKMFGIVNANDYKEFIDGLLI